MSRKTNGSKNEEKKSEVIQSHQQEPLTENEKLGLLLVHERLQSAQTLLQLRQTEQARAMEAVNRRLEENGKYEVVSVDAAKGVALRQPAMPKDLQEKVDAQATAK
jgi:hypothetical protein